MAYIVSDLLHVWSGEHAVDLSGKVDCERRGCDDPSSRDFKKGHVRTICDGVEVSLLPGKGAGLI